MTRRRDDGGRVGRKPHTSIGVSRARHRLLTAAMAAFPLWTPAAEAATRYWSNPFGGSYLSGGNWSTGIAPTSVDDAVFNLSSAGGYTVNFVGDVTTRNVVVRNDRLTLNIGRYNHWSVSPTFGQSTGDQADVTMISGSMSAGSAWIGRNAGSLGTLTIDGLGVGIYANTTDTGSLYVGEYGTGNVYLRNGGVATANYTYVASQPGSNGTVVLEGDNTNFGGSQALYVGGTATAAGGIGTVTIGSGAWAGGGFLLKIYSGSTVTLDGGMLGARVIDAAPGTLVWNSGELAVTGGLTLGEGQLLGPSLTLNAARTLHVSNSNSNGVLTIQPGANLTLAGGTLRANDITGGGTLNFESGTLFMGRDVSFGLDPFFGDNYVLKAGRSLRTYTATVESSASLRIEGGAFDAGDMIVKGNATVASGSLSVNSRGLTVGAGGSTDALLTIGGDANVSVERDIYAGKDGNGAIIHNGGTVANKWGLYVGYDTGWQGTYELSNEGVLSTPGLNVGHAGTGVFRQNGGIHTITYVPSGSGWIPLRLGEQAMGDGTYELNDGALTASGILVGGAGTGRFIQRSGTPAIDTIVLAEQATGRGVYELHDGALTLRGLTVGQRGEGTFTQNGGIVRVQSGWGDMALGSYAGSRGSYTLTNGSLVAAGAVRVGYSGTGTFNQSGGTHSADALWLAPQAGGQSKYNLDGGTLAVGTLYLGPGGTMNYSGGDFSFATRMQVSGGTFNAPGKTFRVGGGAATATYNMGGGTLIADMIELDVGGVMELNGGTLNINTFNHKGGTIVGTLTNTTTYSYSGGALYGKLINRGTVNFNADFTARDGIENFGSMVIPAGRTITAQGTGFTNDGTLELIGTLSAPWEKFGTTAGGSFTQTQGVNNISSLLTIGLAPGTTYTYNLEGGTLSGSGLTLGYSATGVMNIRNGVSATFSGGAWLGEGTAGQGTMNVIGEGTRLTFHGGSVGSGTASKGYLNITGGASVLSTNSLAIVNASGAEGAVTVSGEGTTLTVKSNLTVAGTLSISDGAIVSAESFGAGGSVGTIDVMGAPSGRRSTLQATGPAWWWTNSIGGAAGRLSVSQGALLSTVGSLNIGSSAGNDGTLSVGGASGGFDAEAIISSDLGLGRMVPGWSSYGGRGTLNVYEGGKITVAGAIYAGKTEGGEGIINLDGGQLVTKGLVLAAGQLNLKSGVLTLTGGSLSLYAYTPIIADLSIQGSTAGRSVQVRTTADSRAFVPGNLYIGGDATASGQTGQWDIQDSAAVSVGGTTKLWGPGTLNLSGGSLTTGSLALAGGAFNWTGGTLNITGTSISIGSAGLLGDTLTLSDSGGRYGLGITRTTTIDADGQLLVRGGSFSTGRLINNGIFTFERGQFHLTDSDLTIGAGGLIGSLVTLFEGKTLNVTKAVTIEPDAELVIDGGSFSAGQLVSNGRFSFVRGTLGASADVVLQAGQLLGEDLALGAGSSVTTTQSLIVGDSGAGSLTLTDGGIAASRQGFVAQQVGASGSVLIRGGGSRWSVTDNLYVGGSVTLAGGASEVSVEAGGLLEAGKELRVWPGSTLNIDGGTVKATTFNPRDALTLGSDTSILPVSTALTVRTSGTVRKIGDGNALINGSWVNFNAARIEAGTLTVANGYSGGGTLDIAAGATVELAGGTNTITAAKLTSAGTLRATGGTMTVNGPLNVTGNTEVTNAGTILNNGGTIGPLALRATTTSGAGLTSNADLAIQGPLDWTGGKLSGGKVITVNGPITIGGDRYKALGATLNNAGTALWSGNSNMSRDWSYAATFNNQLGAIFEINHVPLEPARTAEFRDVTFNNHGTVRSTGEGSAIFIGTFNNYGTVELLKGTLAINSPINIPGRFEGAEGTNLYLSGGSGAFRFSDTTVIHSTGNVSLDGTMGDFRGIYDVTGQTKISGSMRILPEAQIRNLGRKLTVSARLEFPAGTVLRAPELQLDSGSIIGTSQVIVDQPFTWTGGGFENAGRVLLNSTTTISNPYSEKSSSDTIFDNAGTVTQTSGSILLRSGAFNNLPGAVYHLQSDTGFSGDFNNQGTLVRTQSANNSQASVADLNNIGLVHVQSGHLRVGDRKNRSQSGTFRVDSGASLTFDLSAQIFNTDSRIVGDGDVKFETAVLGTADIHGAYNVSGSTTIARRLTSTHSAIVTFHPDSKILDMGRTLTINDYGTLNLNTGKTVQLNDLIVYGTLAGTDTIKVDGRITGGGQIKVDVITNGEVNPGFSPGKLTVLGDYTQEREGSLVLELTRPDLVGSGKYIQQFDTVAVSGQASLSGDLDVRMLDGFVPQRGERFKVMTFASRQGIFENIQGWSLGNRLAVEPIYSATDLTLNVRKARDKRWVGSGGDWSSDASWTSAGQPRMGDTVFVENTTDGDQTVSYSNARFPSTVLTALHVDGTGTGRMVLSQASTNDLSVLDVVIGENGNAAIVHSAGRMRIDGTLRVAGGTYDLRGGSLHVGDIINDGQFVQSGGEVNIGGKLTSKGRTVLGGAQRWSKGSELRAEGGSLELNSDAGAGGTAPAVMIGTGVSATVNASQRFATLRVAGSARLAAGRDKTIHTGDLAIDDHGLLDLADNLLVVDATAAARDLVLARLTELVHSARGSGTELWRGDGITSSSARDNPLTGLAVLLNDTGSGGKLVAEQDINAVLVLHTWNGDANVDGTVNALDYFKIDSGFLAGSTGYANGDFNLDGVINALDYFLIDSAFLGQNATFKGASSVAAVPEPSLTLLSTLALGSLLRRRRRGGI